MGEVNYYDTMEYINVRLKADEYSQLNLPHGTKQKIMKKNEETKNKKRRCSEETVRS